jgi:putative membrane protein
VEVLLAYLHYLSIIATGSFLTAELILCRPPLGEAQLRQLTRVDIAYFVSALGALATGVLRLFFYAKGLGFYLPNPAFQAKLGLYVVVAVLSVRPTMRFIRWSRGLALGAGPPDAAEVRAVRRLVHVELMLLALIPLMAVLMARGIGR